MSLEACPACGYALSISDSRCRHCGGGMGAQLAVKTGGLRAFLAGKNITAMKLVRTVGFAAVTGFLVYYILTH